MGNAGQLIGIATRPARKAPMNEVAAASITATHGVDQDARGAPGRRQVTVMTRSGWASACSELGADHMSWTTRRANLLVYGLQLEGKVGYELRIGRAVLVINGETRPCKIMDDACPGLREALRPEWRGGVICRVKQPGEIALGDVVVLARDPIRHSARLVQYRTRSLRKRYGARIVRCARVARGLIHRGWTSHHSDTGADRATSADANVLTPMVPTSRRRSSPTATCTPTEKRRF